MAESGMQVCVKGNPIIYIKGSWDAFSAVQLKNAGGLSYAMRVVMTPELPWGQQSLSSSKKIQHDVFSAPLDLAFWGSQAIKRSMVAAAEELESCVGEAWHIRKEYNGWQSPTNARYRSNKDSQFSSSLLLIYWRKQQLKAAFCVTTSTLSL